MKIGTAGELKALLEKVSDDTLINMEGCDCEGFWGGPEAVETTTNSGWCAVDVEVGTPILTLLRGKEQYDVEADTESGGDNEAAGD